MRERRRKPAETARQAARNLPVSERLRDVLDELAVLPLLEGRERAQSVAYVRGEMRGLPAGFAPMARQAAERLAAYMKTNNKRELQPLTDSIESIL